MPAPRRAPRALPALGVAVPAVALLALTSCSNGQAPVNRTPLSGTATASAVGGVQQITIDVGDDFRFHPATIVVHPGTVRIVLKHTGTGAPHDWALTGFPADFVPQTNAGQTREASFVAPSPGSYSFVCTFHAQQGMRGTLIVRPN